MSRAVYLYQDYTNDDDFVNFTSDKAIDFKSWLRKRKFKGKEIAMNSYRTYLIHLRNFFTWLCTQSGYKSKINLASIEYLKVSKKESRLAAQSTIRRFPMKEYIKELITSIEDEDEIGMRNRALISFTFLTGMRDSAIISLPIRCVNIEKMYVVQNPNYGVKVKFNKIIYSKIFPFDDDLIKIFIEWIEYLKKKGFSPDDPLFPRAKIKHGNESLSFETPTEVEPKFWVSTDSLRRIFKEQAKKINKESYPPHTFRHSAIFYALRYAKDGEEIKAVSQNFGHEDIGTTLSVYAKLNPEHLLDVLARMEFKKSDGSEEQRILEIMKKLFKDKFNSDG